MKSDVFFIELKTADVKAAANGLTDFLRKTASFSAYKKGEIVPVKLTVGDSRSAFHVKPEMIKAVVTEIKNNSAKPFIFDTSVIYTGSRQNAVDHMNLAQNKGFGHTKVGAPFIIADGLFGRDGVDIRINGKFIEKIRTPSFVGMLDSIVALSHITGHILSGYAGAIKNIAMGMACRASKQVQHSKVKPGVITEKCTACGLCIAICPARAISVKGEKSYIDADKCVGCAECLCACKFDAIRINWEESPDIFSKRMVEVANAILSRFRNPFFINFAIDITKECDCISTKDDKIICPDIGILASRDIVSLDKATIDLMLKNGNVFRKEELAVVYDDMLEYAEEIGLGTQKYNLVSS